MQTMKCIELFCGTKSFTKIAQAKGHDCFTVDIDKKFKPNLCKDILEMTIDDIPLEFQNPDIIWASPPCTTFSVASIGKYWINGKPKNAETLIGIAIVKKTLQIIEYLKPKYFFIENPRGMLRKQIFMKNVGNSLFNETLRRRTVSYCSYGFEYQKPTDIWTNCVKWKPHKMCKPKSYCHTQSPRGSGKGLAAAHRSAEDRSRIPSGLFLEIFHSIENEDYLDDG